MSDGLVKPSQPTFMSYIINEIGDKNNDLYSIKHSLTEILIRLRGNTPQEDKEQPKKSESLCIEDSVKNGFDDTKNIISQIKILIQEFGQFI